MTSTPTSPSASWPRWRCSLGLSPAFVFGAYEDAFYYLWRERRLPTNVDPFASNLEDAGERERLARVFEQGSTLQSVTCFPIAAHGRWSSLGNRSVVPEARALLSDPRRFAGGLALAARLDAVGRTRRLSLHAFARSVAGVSAAARSSRRFGVSCAISIAWRPQHARPSGNRCAARAPAQQESAALDHPHRHVRRTARRRALHLHAARQPTRGLPRARHRGRSGSGSRSASL